MGLRRVKIGDFLKRIKRSVQIVDDVEYKLVTIRINHKGVALRELKRGAEIKSNMYEVRDGDFILSGIDARNGAFGIISEELDRAIVTNDFWYFDVDEAIIDKQFFLTLTSTSWFDEICKRGSDGTTQRIRLQKDKFFDQEIMLPSIEEQKLLAKKINIIQKKQLAISEEITQQKEYLKKLKQSILQDAISGKLTQEWRANNPNIEPATQLLKQIKTTKQQQIKEGKLRKEKPLDPIDESTLPFTIPPTWTWCRLGDVSTSIVPNRDKPQSFSGNTPWITQSNFTESAFKLKYTHNNLGLSNDEIIKYNARTMPKGSVIMSCVGRFDIVAVADHPVVANQQLHCFIPYCDIIPDYIAYSVKILSNMMNDKAIKTTIKYLNKTKCESILLPLPPIQEQKIIEENVSYLLNTCYSIENQISNLEQTAQQLTKSILTETFNR